MNRCSHRRLATGQCVHWTTATRQAPVCFCTSGREASVKMTDCHAESRADRIAHQDNFIDINAIRRHTSQYLDSNLSISIDIRVRSTDRIWLQAGMDLRNKSSVEPNMRTGQIVYLRFLLMLRVYSKNSF